MKTLICGLLTVAAIGVALPAAAETVVRERPNGTVVVRHVHHHRVVWFDHHGHRHVSFR